MSIVSEIEFRDKVNLTENLNLSDTLPYLRRLIQYRKELARRIIETCYDNSAYRELLEMNGDEIKRLLGI